MSNLSKSSSSRAAFRASSWRFRAALSGLALLGVGGLCAIGASAQTAPKPGTVESAPLPPPTGATPAVQAPIPQAAPQAQGTPPAPAAPATPGQSADAANATLGPAPA